MDHTEKKVVEFIKIVYLSVKQLLPQTDFTQNVKIFDPEIPNFYFNQDAKFTNIKTELSVTMKIFHFFRHS